MSNMAPDPTSPPILLDEPMEKLSEAEESFELWRRRTGTVLAPLVFLVVWMLPMSGLKPEAHHLAAIMATVITLWITEALPMPITALAGACACVVCGVAPAKTVFAPFAEPLMFLFIGSFILARAIFVHHLDRRLAFGVLSQPFIGASPSRILFAFGAVTAGLSAWMSNTATTAMMFAIGMSILAFLMRRRADGQVLDRRYATGLMLMTSFAASVGGLATPVGSPPNLIGKGYLEKAIGAPITFFQWMTIGVPVVVILFLFMYTYLNWLCPAGVTSAAGSEAMIIDERRKLGPWTRAQKSTLIAFLFTVSLWIAPGLFALILGSEHPWYEPLTKRYLAEAVVAVLGVVLLFMLPGNERGQRAMTWEEATKIDWGVVLIYGGGFTLSVLAEQTGLAQALAEGMKSAFVFEQEWVLILVATLVAALTSELTSNTASAQLVVPFVIGYAKAIDVDPLGPGLAATFGSSLGFMLPVSTPCNAIVYGSGYIPIGRMVRYGFILDVTGVIVVTATITMLLPFLRG
jgi:sodium-dependent dicarboxylate transporter 2/3/5